MTIAEITPTQAPGLLLKVLAILGGAVFIGLLTGFVFRFLTRMLTTRPLPLWAVRIVRLAGGVLGGWLVALWVFGGGGGGIGGGGGFGLGAGKDGGAGKKESEEKRKDEKPPPTDKEKPPGGESLMIVTVLGLKDLRERVGKEDPDLDYSYHIQGEPANTVRNLEQVKEELLKRKKEKPDLKVTVGTTEHTPARGNAIRDSIEVWLRDQDLLLAPKKDTR
jgi:hypothetical protein